jgi:hypothetical protein
MVSNSKLKDLEVEAMLGVAVGVGKPEMRGRVVPVA